MPVQTFLPYSRKSGLFGQIVAQTREVWQTLELYPTQISEVHQNYPGHGKFIWARREWLGHPISKKKWSKRLIFRWVVTGISFWTTNWTTNDYTTWLQIVFYLIDYNLQLDHTTILYYNWPQNWFDDWLTDLYDHTQVGWHYKFDWRASNDDWLQKWLQIDFNLNGLLTN
jgi:hypothetical protein